MRAHRGGRRVRSWVPEDAALCGGLTKARFIMCDRQSARAMHYRNIAANNFATRISGTFLTVGADQTRTQ